MVSQLFCCFLHSQMMMDCIFSTKFRHSAQNNKNSSLLLCLFCLLKKEKMRTKQKYYSARVVVVTHKQFLKKQCPYSGHHNHWYLMIS